MPLKLSVGNMYPWVTHTHCHLGGECPHRCSYCYVNNPRFGRPEKYTGALRLIESEFSVRYGQGKTVFVENMNDLFAAEVPSEFIDRILAHCREWPLSTFVFQTKNPARFAEFMDRIPGNSILGTTIESNRVFREVMRSAPPPSERHRAMASIRKASRPNARLFVTVEPVLQFDRDELAAMLADVQPDFLNIGADSKGKGLPEPSRAEVLSLVEELKRRGIDVRIKHNLERLTAA